MHIRFTSSPILGPMQISKGQVLDLPADLAKQYVDDGLAETLTPEEVASLPRTGDVAGFFPAPAAKPKKGRR